MKKEKSKGWRRVRRVLLIVLGVFLLCEGALYALVEYHAATAYMPEAADVIIVLGAGIREDGTPKPALARRLDVAKRLYDDGYAPLIIVTGAQGSDEPITEAQSMKTYLVAAGVPDGAVILEPASYNTRQNLENAKLIMDENGLTDAIAVSSDFHIWRTLALCRDIGIKATGAGSLNAETFIERRRNCLRETVSWNKFLITR